MQAAKSKFFYQGRQPLYLEYYGLKTINMRIPFITVKSSITSFMAGQMSRYTSTRAQWDYNEISFP